MNDTKTTITELKKLAQVFIEERDWQQFHDPKNDSMMIATEAAELMEIFRFVDNKDSRVVFEQKRTVVEHEIADIAFGLFYFCQNYSIDLSQAFKAKMLHNAQKYPVEKVHGRNNKYTEYEAESVKE